MATSSHKEWRIFFNSKEGTAGTKDTYEFFEGRSITATFPTTNYLKESDYAKLGAGEHGTKSEVQAAFCPVSFKAQRLSEVAFLMSYALGKTDVPALVDTGVYNHEMEHLPVTSRTLPTFSFQMGNQAASACDSFTHTFINDFSVTLAEGGNGVIDATFNGFTNLYYDSSGTITRNATVDNSSFSAGATFTSEPLINYKSCQIWKGTMEATPLVQANISESATDLTSATELTADLNTITFGMSNGLTADNVLRAGGFGVINSVERKDQTFTLELGLQRNNDFDASALANTQTAIELQFAGPIIASTYRYGMNLFWPVVQIGDVARDEGSPINETLPCEVFQDSSHMAFYAYFFNAFDSAMNSTLT